MKLKLCAFADEAGATLNEQISALKRNQISLLELRSINSINILDITEKDAIDIKKALDSENIEVFSLGSPIGKVNINEDFLSCQNKLRHILTLANIFECSKIRMFSFFIDNPKRDRNEVIDRLNSLVQIAKDKDVLLYHENEKDIYGDTADRVLDILNNVEGLKSIFDPANYIQVGEDIAYAIQNVLPKADYLHIKDAIKLTGEIVPSGYGDGKILKIIKTLKKDTVLTIEPHLALFGSYKDIDKNELKTKFKFLTNDEAFDAACNALKNLLVSANYSLVDGVYAL